MTHFFNTTQLLLTFSFSAICWKQHLYFFTEKLYSCPKKWWNVSFRNILLMSYLGPPLAGCPGNNHHPEWVGVGWWRGTFNYKGDLVNWRTLGSVFDKLVGASHHDNLIEALCCWFNVDDDLFRVFNEATQEKVLEQKSEALFCDTTGYPKEKETGFLLLLNKDTDTDTFFIANF